jgi:hypothetical protein
MVNDPRTRPLLKGEGEFKGQVFELTSWRREGLLARLRGQGFTVRTLADQVAKLPLPPPRPVPIRDAALRPLTSEIDRFSYFDPLALSWVHVEPQEAHGEQVVMLREGWVVRRRRGRGASSFHQVFIERGGGVGLRPLGETEALLAGYAQATASHSREIAARRAGKEYLLPDLELPQPYQAVLGRFAKLTPEGWRVMERGLPLAQELYARLGLLLTIGGS